MHTQLDRDLVRIVFTLTKKPVADAQGDVIRGLKGQV